MAERLIRKKSVRLASAAAALIVLGFCGGGGGSSGGGTGSGGGGTPTPTPTPTPVTIAFSNAGTPFYVDDREISVNIGAASAGGTSVTPSTLVITSNIDGQVASGLSLNSTARFRLTDGTHTLTLRGDFGTNGTATQTLEIVVLPRRPEIPAGMKQAANTDVKVPVVLVSWIPTVDGKTLDTAVADYNVRPWGNDTAVPSIQDYIDLIFVQKVFSLTEMSRFRGYKQSSNPYLGYEVVDHIAFYGPYPQKNYAPDTSKKIADYSKIMQDISAQNFVENNGVKEVWLATYFAGDEVLLWESNMSSPTSGDISNSDRRTDDLPVYSKTYVVYGMNYHRTQAEAVHNHGHQIEAMLSYLDLRDNGQHDIFWNSYVGAKNFPTSTTLELGLCGWTHTPPYTQDNYGFLSTGSVQSNCGDWHPDGSGVRTTVNANYMKNLPYTWPIARPVQDTESNFYIWWGQNMPGKNNSIPFGSTTMRNWWQLMNDWDASVTSNAKLYN